MTEEFSQKPPLQMCYLGHPVLRQKAEVIKTETAEIAKLAADMITTMQIHDGIGLAGNQIGRRLRIVALDVPMPKPADRPFMSPGERVLLAMMPMVLINPELSEYATETSEYSEGCLSIPDVHAMVVRPVALRLRAKVVGGAAIDLPCGGLLARCLMHEMDHLEGMLFIDRLQPRQIAAIQARLEEVEAATRAGTAGRIGNSQPGAKS